VTTWRDGRYGLPPRVCHEVLVLGETLLIPRTTDDPALRSVLTELAAQDCIAAPLVSGGQASGVIVICDRLGEVSTFDAEDARLFATLASQAAIALENGRLIDRLQEQVLAREHEATHDALTGLPNRSLFAERLAEALEARPQRVIGVLLMDLDGFKDVNDTLGHHAGDNLLCQVGYRVHECISGRGTVARLGGDEFAVLLPDLDDAATASRIAREINDTVRAPVLLGALTMEIGASIGVAVSPDHGDDPSTLLQRADVAMYAAKRAKSGVSSYDPAADQNSEVQLQLAGELRAAIASHQIQVWYQPIARCTDGQVVAAEALVRWDHPGLGRIGPEQFIPIAERSGLIHELTIYVTDLALSQARSWRAGGMDLDVTVNLPPQVLRDLEWPGKVNHLLRKHAASPSWLTFEVTETGIMSDPPHMIRMLDEMAAAGIRFAIDDFGTGYSSLAYLQQLPVSKVKIDRSFVTPMTTDPANASIVRSVIDLARSLGLEVVAEGVEDQRTLDLLTDIGCGLVQGYYLSKPIPAAELTEWMALRTSRQPAGVAGPSGG
jgi:diguanylate cyclase (GGDEF)-like protein